MDINQEPPVKLVGPEKLWTEDDAYKYALPKPEGDIWASCLDPLLKEDEKQCKAWRDEVQNLLIFAGLFSAVVTTFVVDSYKNLQPSPDQRTVDLLSQIVARLGNDSNASPSSSFATPSPSSIRVNALWFTSLVISLTTALIGIVSLQWISEYQWYSGHWTPKQIFELRNMRHESMDKWFVPQVFSGLSLLLQSALILFFIGLIDFLLHVNPLAATPTVIIISATCLFLVITTTLPSLQYYATYASRRSDIPATPLPYKSPQSWAFLRATELTLRFLYFCKRDMSRVVSLLFRRRELDPWAGMRTIPNLSNWNTFDWRWVGKRSCQILRFGYQIDGSYHYDTANGVAHIITNYCQSNKPLSLSAYHCFLELNATYSAVHFWNSRSQSHFYKSLKPTGVIFRNIEIPKSSTRDTSLMIFLELFRIRSNSISSFMILKHQLELLIRIHNNFPDIGIEEPFLRQTVNDFLWFATSLTQQSLEETYNEDLTSQLLLLYQRLVEAAIYTGDRKTPCLENADVARIIARMDWFSIPSIVRFRELIEPLHVSLAYKILKTRTDVKSSGFTHRLGFIFIEPIVRIRNVSLPEWSETYQESLAFLVAAVLKTCVGIVPAIHDPPPVYYNDDMWISKMEDFLDRIPLDMRERINHRCDLALEQQSGDMQYDPQNILPLLPDFKPPLKKTPTSDFDVKSTMTIPLLPQEPHHTIDMELSYEP